MSKNKLGSLIGLAAGAALALSMVAPAFALTASDIDLLGVLLNLTPAQISAAKAALGAQTTTTTVSAGYSFTRDLTIGSTGADVTALQNWLISNGYSIPAGATGYFGAQTQAALAKYQAATGITPAAGYFGPKTRAALSSTGGTVSTGTGTTVIPSGTSLNVSLAPTSPFSGAIVAGQAAADLVEYTFTNTSATPAVVTNVSLQRGGVSADTNLPNVYLYQGAIRLTDAASVSSGKITFNSSTGLFTVAPGTSVTIAVRSDIDQGTAAGAVVNLSLTGVTANVPVAASYPISGASFTVAQATNLSQATSTLTGSPVAAGTITAGSMNQTIWETNLSLANSQGVWLKSLALKVIGSIPSNALQNFNLYVSGVQVATAAGIDANGMVTFDLTANPYKIDSSRTLEVRADVVGGSSRTFTVQLQNASDLQLVDSNYNVAIAVGLSGSQASGTWTINGASGGTITVVQDPSLSSGDIIAGASNVALARFTVKAYGEDEKIQYINATSSASLQNVALYANGVQIGSTKNITANATTTFSVGSSLIVPSGGTATLEIRGDVKDLSGLNVATGTQVTLGLLPYVGSAQGQYSQLIQTFPTAEIDGPAMTVKQGGVSLSANSAYSDQTVTPNTNNVKLGSYTIQAGSAEPIRVTSVSVALNNAQAGATTNVSNLYIVAGGQTTNPVNPNASNNFTTDFTVPANGSATIDVFGNLSTVSGTASTSLTISGYGTQSNVSITATTTGQTLTVGQGTLAVPTLQLGAGFSPISQFVVGNTTSVLGVYNFISTNGSSFIKELYFNASGTGASDITSVSVGGFTAPVVGGQATLTGLNTEVDPSNAGVNVPVTVTFNKIGQNGQPTDLTSGLRLTGFKYTSGNTTVTTTTLAVDTNLMTVLASKPTVTVTNLSGLAQNGSNDVVRVTVSADAGGQINLLSLPIKISLGGNATTTNSFPDVLVQGTSIVNTLQATTSAFVSGSSTITFTGSGYPIQAGSSVTFDVYVQTTGTNAGGGSVSGQLGSASALTFNDVNGSSTLPISGSLIYNYPLNQVSGSYTY